MDRNKVKTIMMWILYVAVCLCSAALPLAEKAIRKNLIGKEEHDNVERNTTYYRNYSNRRSFR